MHKEELNYHFKGVSLFLSLSLSPFLLLQQATFTLRVHSPHWWLGSKRSIPVFFYFWNVYCAVLRTKKDYAHQIHLSDHNFRRQFDYPLFCHSFNIIPSQTENNEPCQLKLMTIFNIMVWPSPWTAALRRSGWGRTLTLLACFSYFMTKWEFLPCTRSYCVKDDYFSFEFMSFCSH